MRACVHAGCAPAAGGEAANSSHMTGGLPANLFVCVCETELPSAHYHQRRIRVRRAKEQQRIADDLARLIDSANAPIFGVDLKGMVTEWNRKAADIMGYTKEEAIGKHMVSMFIEPENRQSVDEILSRALAGSETANYALPLLSKFGMRYTVLLNATTRRDAKNQIVGVVGVGQDITQLNQVWPPSHRSSAEAPVVSSFF